jgi:hypothetical protein
LDPRRSGMECGVSFTIRKFTLYIVQAYIPIIMRECMSAFINSNRQTYKKDALRKLNI